MSHVEGHLEEGWGSCGILKLKNGNEELGIYFVPPFRRNTETNELWEPKKQEAGPADVGFHILQVPITEKDKERGYAIIAYDVVPIKNHKDAETRILAKMGATKKLEECDPEQIAKAVSRIQAEDVRDGKIDGMPVDDFNEIAYQTIRFLRTSEGQWRIKNSGGAEDKDDTMIKGELAKLIKNDNPQMKSHDAENMKNRRNILRLT